MDEAIRFLKAHKSQILKYGKKAFTWWKKNNKGKNDQKPPTSSSLSSGGGGGYAGAVSASSGGYAQAQQGGYGGYDSSSQTYNGAGGGGGGGGGGGYGFGQPAPPQGQYGHPGQGGGFGGQSGLKPTHPNYNDNAVNSKNQRYTQLRSQARQEGDLMAKCFDQSHSAYSHGDGAKAKQLSNEGHQHKARMEQLNKEASDWIYKANNEDSGPDEVDLHGLFTAEAITRTEEEIARRQARGDATVRIIVGKGMHSKDKVAHIKPAIEDLMRKYNLQAHLDPTNAGVLVVDLTGHAAGGGFGRDVGGMTRGLAKAASGDEDSCIIM